jgi:flavoprotein
MSQYLLYVLRWVVLAIPGAAFFNGVKQLFGIADVYVAMIISQAMMGAMVYFVDRLIFASGRIPIPFEVRQRAVCADCGRVGKCYRVAGTRCCEISPTSAAARFRCEGCAVKYHSK